MKRGLFVAGLVALWLCVASTAFSQQPRSMPIEGTAETSEPYFGMDFLFHVPLLDLADQTGTAVGALARLEVPVALNSNFTLRTGYLFSFRTDAVFGGRSSRDMAPIFGGFRFYPSGGPTDGGGFFLMPELGPVVHVFRAQNQSNAVRLRAGGAIGLGYHGEPVVVQASLLMPSFGHISDELGLLFSVGFNF